MDTLKDKPLHPYYRQHDYFWMFQPLGISVGSLTLSVFNWFIFLLRIGGSNLGPRVMQASSSCPILPQHQQINVCITWIS